jgi:hypothetical protein
MGKPRTFIPKNIREELEATGLPWTVEVGTKHQHIRLAGKLVCVVPRRGGGVLVE